MTAHHVEHEIATRITGWGKPAAPAMKREVERTGGGAMTLRASDLSPTTRGYADGSEPIGQLGEQTSYYHPGIGQMYSSPRDMTAFLAANLSMTAPPAPLRPS